MFKIRVVDDEKYPSGFARYLFSLLLTHNFKAYLVPSSIFLKFIIMGWWRVGGAWLRLG